METNVGKTSIRDMKQMAKKNLQSLYALPKTISSLGIVAIKDKEKRAFILKGISAIGLGAIVIDDDIFDISNIVSVKKVSQNELVGFDFFVFDNEHEGVDVMQYMRA